jgi:asparagine synthase (glutamine-hydrolysing)
MRDSVGDTDPMADYADLVLQGHGQLVDRCLVADQAYYLPGDLLVKSDAMSMAHGLEVRVPFLDRRVMEFAGRIHTCLLTPLRGPDKLLLRRAAGRLGMPTSVTSAPKHGFNVPVARLLRNALRPLCDMFLNRNPDILAPYLDPDGIRKLWLDHQDGRANHGYVLWTLLTLAVWRACPRLTTDHSMIMA